MLGVILTPYGARSPYGWYAEIAQARGGQGGYLPQPGPFPLTDRFFSTRGEVGLYYDTQLGAIRTSNGSSSGYTSGSKCPSGYVWACSYGRCGCRPSSLSAAAVEYAHGHSAAAHMLHSSPSGLGDMIPTDAEMAKTYVCYTPVHSGWINTPNGYLPTPWRFGWNPAGAYGPETSLHGAMGRLSTPAKIALAAIASIGGIFALKKFSKKRRR